MYNIRGTLSCNNLNAVYSISCKNCGDHYVGSAAGFKARFKIRKSNIKTKKYRFGTARHFKNKFFDRSNSQIYLQVQLIKSAQNDVNLEGRLWERVNYWQCQLFNNAHGINSVSDLYSIKKKRLQEKLVALGLFVFVLFMQCLHNCLWSRLLRYLPTAILQMPLVYFSVYVKNQLRCSATVTFAKEIFCSIIWLS